MSLGKEGENLAAEHLIRCGFRVVERNVRFRNGEIDIVAEKEGILYIFEVRTVRKGLANPLETIDQRKRERVWRAAEHYMMRRNWNGPCEIGYVGIDASEMPPKLEFVLDDG